MAAPIAGFVQLPLDTGNTGKKVRTQTRIVGADTVHEHHYIPISSRKIDGIYYFSLAVQSVQASAQNGTSTGFFWLERPVGGTGRGRLRQLQIAFAMGAAPTADHLTLPRIALVRFTFTGTASGALITPALRHPNDAVNVSNVRTAVTGMTVTVGAVAFVGFPPGIDFATAVGQNTIPKDVCWFNPIHEDEYIDFGPGQGLLLYQPDAGTTADVRRFFVNGAWDEYDNA